MRIPLEDVSILEGPWLPLVSIDHQVLGLWAVLRDKRPLSRFWNPSPAPTAEVFPGDFFNDLRWRPRRKRFLGCDVTSARNVRLPLGTLCVFKPRGEHGPVCGNKRFHPPPPTTTRRGGARRCRGGG